MHAKRAAADPTRAVAAIGEWLKQGGLAPLAIEPLAGDLSARAYFRVRFAGDDPARIVARYPAELRAAQRRFTAATSLLAGNGIRVPRLLRDDPDMGLSLLEDLGTATLYETVGSWREAPRELAAALAVIRSIAVLDPRRVAELGSPPLDAALLRQELAQTEKRFAEMADFFSAELAALFDRLCERLGGGKLVPCHRDLMARNLMPLPGGGVAVLDHQDLRLGPPAYDLASLLNDSLFADPELESAALAQFAEFGREQYRRAVVQRTFKAVGTYLSFAARDESRHLGLVSPTLERALRLLGDPPDLDLDPKVVESLRRAVGTVALC